MKVKSLNNFSANQYKSFVFKTSLNDKLINHTIDFEFAFNKINNVR